MWHGTLGRAGHSSEILKRIPNGHLYCFRVKINRQFWNQKADWRQLAVILRLSMPAFKNLKSELENRGVDEIDGLLLDLGVSSPQFDEASRGFSYRYDAPLDMRMDQSQPLSAYEVVNTYEFNELMRIFYRYGEDSFAKQVARKIEQARSEVH